MQKKRVIIDSDPAIGVRFRDIDDGLAILFLLASPEVTLEGITVNFGNVKAPLGYRVAQEVLKVAQREIPVYLGAQSKHDLGKPNPAVDFMLETVNKNPGEISLLAVAPLTNVATAMMLDKTFARNLRELIIMGGSVNFGIFAYIGEFNFHLDGKAASLVTSYPISKAVITSDVCTHAVFQDRHLKRFQQNTRAVSKYLAEKIPHWLNINKKVFYRKKGFFPWDVVAAAFLVDRSLFDENPCSFRVEESGIRSGRIFDLKKYTSFAQTDTIVPVDLPLFLDQERFMEMFISRLLTL